MGAGIPADPRVLTSLQNRLPDALCLSGLALLGYCAFLWAGAVQFDREQGRRLDELRQRRVVQASAAPAVTSPAATAPVVAAPVEAPVKGLIGRITIPRLALSAIVVEGVGSAALRRAVGHVPRSALPGEEGNVVIAGHRDTHFRSLAGLLRGDLIDVATVDGDFRYQVVSMTIVSPSHVEVMDPGEGESLTLITCYPFHFIGPAPDRFVVRAKRFN